MAARVAGGPRVDRAIAERPGYHDEDDLAALVQLKELAGSAEAVATGSTQFSERQALLEQVIPVVALALKHLAIAVILGQARGRFPRLSHEWADQVLGLDYSHKGDWHIMGGHLPLAIAAGIKPESIEGLHAGRLQDLTEMERQVVQFTREICEGRVTDESWAKQLEIAGSERGVVEQVCNTLLGYTHIRIAQALGFSGTSDEDYWKLMAALREGSRKPGDLDAYERYFMDLPWPTGADR